jgi:hypothetical protein
MAPFRCCNCVLVKRQQRRLAFSLLLKGIGVIPKLSIRVFTNWDAAIPIAYSKFRDPACSKSLIVEGEISGCRFSRGYRRPALKPECGCCSYPRRASKRLTACTDSNGVSIEEKEEKEIQATPADDVLERRA